MSVALRIKQHEVGRVQMFSGKYYQALSTLQQALHKHGPHVGLISDLIAVLYLLGRVEDGDSMIEKLQAELDIASHKISADSFSKTKIFLGKTLEEQAKVERALIAYAEAAAKANIEFNTKVKAQAQLLRLRSFLGIKADLPVLYKICLQAKLESKNLITELEHGLMLAEIILFGVSFAKQRVLGLIQDNETSLYDKRLVIFDFLEEVLRQNLDISEHHELLKVIDISELDEFEKTIYAMVADVKFELTAGDFNRLSGQVAVMNLLRLLLLNSKRSRKELLVVESRRRFLFLLETLTYESKALLIRKWQNDLGDQNQVIKYNVSDRKFEVNSRVLVFKKDSFADKCLSLFCDKKEVDIEFFVSRVFESDYDQSYHDRVRIALIRLNKELAVVTGSNKLFKVTKSKVEVQSGFQIIHSA